MSRRVFIETTTSGKAKFVKLKRSHTHHGHSHRHHHNPFEHLDHLFDHHHHHHHHKHKHHKHHKHCHDPEPEPVPCREYYKVSVEEWNILKERERCLDEQNRSLVDENKALRTSLSAAQADVHRLEHCVVPELQARNDALYADNQSLRRSIDNATEQAARHHAEMEKLRCRNDKLEKEAKDAREEACDLRDRIRHLTKQLDQSCNRRVAELARDVARWKEETRYWKSKFEDLERRHCEMLDTLEMRTERMEAYEELLKRRCII